MLRLLFDELALHVVHLGARAHHHAAAEQYLEQENDHQDVGVLRHLLLYAVIATTLSQLGTP